MGGRDGSTWKCRRQWEVGMAPPGSMGGRDGSTWKCRRQWEVGMALPGSVGDSGR